MPQNEIEILVPTENLRSVEGSQLFYPHSGSDLIVPIRLFAPYVADLWFIDLAYFRADSRVGQTVPADVAPPVLEDYNNYRLESVEVIGPPAAKMEWRMDESKNPPERYDFLEPCVRTETYVHLPLNMRFRVHRRRGYSVSGFRKEITNLGVFFYRGDSSEGSNVPWLKKPFLPRVLDALMNKGLVVTDGSRACPSGRYQELRRFHSSRDIGSRAVELAVDFYDKRGRQFRCVGYAGERHGRSTLIWEVSKSSNPR